MKRFLITLLIYSFIQPVFAWNVSELFTNHDERSVRRTIMSQVKYANKTNFEKFIGTYDSEYESCDGFNLEVYSNLVKDIWETYKDIHYGIKIKNIKVEDNRAVVEVTEYSNADIKLTDNVNGALKSESESIYYLRKSNDGKWKVLSDLVLDERTSMLYGEAKNLDIKLDAPLQVQEDTEYSASLEFVPPEGTLAIASISSDKVEYPQKAAKEVFRTMPEDNILERLFTSNSDKVNEYIVASIGLTKTDVCDLSIKLSLTGFGYVIRRVNVIPAKIEECVNEQAK